jgi:hypothetical protein
MDNQQAMRAALEEIKRAICVIGIVGNINEHDVIRRNSVLDIIDQRIAALSAAPSSGEDAGQQLARHQPCGCVICWCEDEEQCHGCGAKHCGTHPIGEIPNPVYATSQPSVPADEREMPPLPEPVTTAQKLVGIGECDFYSADQIRERDAMWQERVRAAVEQALAQQAVRREPAYDYNRTMNAIAQATEIQGPKTLAISAKKFWEVYGAAPLAQPAVPEGFVIVPKSFGDAVQMLVLTANNACQAPTPHFLSRLMTATREVASLIAAAPAQKE